MVGIVLSTVGTPSASLCDNSRDQDVVGIRNRGQPSTLAATSSTKACVLRLRYLFLGW